MKKYFMIFAAALLSFAACQEEMAPETPLDQDGIFDYPVKMTFTAGNEAAAKTVISGTSITWESDDEIKVMWSETGYNKAKAEPFGENTCAKFTTNVEEADAYYAVHPYAAESSYSEGSIVVTIPSEQGGAFENANIAVAKATENYAFPFRHLVGMIEFTTDTPGKVTISGAEGDVLTGTVTVTGFDENGYPVYSEDKVTDASSVIEIDVKASGTYYAAFLPSATLKCLSVKVEGSEATEYALSANQLKMARGKVIELGNIDTKFGKNLFVSASADGKGDGKTWETALTFQQMANMVAARNSEGPSAPSGDTNVAVDKAGTEYLAWHNGVRAAALDGVTFHIAVGTYKTSSYVRISFPNRENAVKLSFKGGYSSESKGTDLSKRFVDAEDVTVMTGEDKRRHFFVRYSSDLTFDGITFANGKPDFDGGSILFNESGTSILNFNNCKFDSNSAGAHPGGAICGGGEAKDVGTAIFNKCEFISNSSNAGGAVYANSGVWKFKDCTIKNNSSTGASGAFHMEADTEVSISGGSFETNTAVSDGGAMRVASKSFVADDVDFIGNKGAQTTAGNSQGGAIYFANNESGSERTVSNCLFKENTVDAAHAVYSTETNGTKNYVRGGAVYIQSSSPNVVFTTCTFESNKQLNATESYKTFGGGAIYATKSFTATGCTFKTNDAYQFGAIGIENGTVSINGTFTSNTAVNGGAVGAYGGSISFTECEFSQNSSSSFGGVGYVTNAGVSLTFTDCDIDGNTSVNNGGAFHFNPIKKATFTDCDITNNTVTGTNTGGAFYLSSASSVDITRGTITGNTAGSIGGAFYSSNKETVVIDGTTISGNKANKGEGGAIRFVGAGNWTIKNATVSDNYATSNGGAIYAHTGTLTIENTTFSGNECGGTAGGGAVYVTSDGVLSASGSTFSSNSSPNGGGAVTVANTADRAIHKIDNCIFSGNAAKQGAALRTAYTVYVNGCSFAGNVPSNTNTGGTVYVAAASFINNCSFYGYNGSSNNTSLVLSGGASTVLNTTLYESSDKATAVRLYNSGASANIYNNVIIAGSNSVAAGWGNLTGSVTSCGYNYTRAWKTGADSGTTASASTISTDTVVTDPALFTQASTTDGRGYYTWTKPAEVTGTTKANVTAFLNGITGGSDFATWLGTVGGLTHDLAGNERPAEGAWYPGCYQGK